MKISLAKSSKKCQNISNKGGFVEVGFFLNNGNPVMYIDPSGLAYDINMHRKLSRGVDAHILGNQVTITVNVWFSGGSVEKSVPDSPWFTYKDAAIAGILEWQGSTEGRTIIININKKTEIDYNNDPYNVLQFNISASDDIDAMFTGGNADKVFGEIRLFPNAENFRRFSSNAAHEFGHILGIRDLYDDWKALDHGGVYRSCMNNRGYGPHTIDRWMFFRVLENNSEHEFWRDNIDLIHKYNQYYDPNTIWDVCTPV